MRRNITVILLLTIATINLYAQNLQYPKTEKIDHVDTYFGTHVADPYRWLERNDSSAVIEWIAAQNKVTFGYLEKIPFREKIKERLTSIWNYPKYSAPYREGENYFFYKNDGLQNQSVLYIQKGLEGKPEVFLDPNTFSKDGTVALSGSSVSKDGKYFAYSISKSGSDWVEIFVIDIEKRKKLNDHLTWAKFTGMSWHGKGFYYNRYEALRDTSKTYVAVNENQKVFYHTTGTDQSEDKLIYEDKSHPRRMFGIGATEDERFLLLSISEGSAKGNALYCRDLKKGDTEWNPIIEIFDDRIWVIDNIDDKLLCYTNKNASRGKIILIDPEKPDEKQWKEILHEQENVLSNVSTVGDKMIATYMKDANHHVYQYDLTGRLESEIELPALSTVGGFGGKRDDTFTFYTVTSFMYPNTIYRYDLKTMKSTLYRTPDIDFDFKQYETKQVFYKSNDGTPIPMFIVHKKGLKLDGVNPTLLYGYGGFNASMTPSFSVSRLIWLENGGVYAMVNLRGGGEYGEKWHEAGTKLNKQNVFDDFIGAAEYLIKEKFTSPDKLAIQGGSNGGLLVGAVMNQRPELFKVALPAVGVMDMLRFHKFTIGWAWVNDYGSSDDSVQYQALYKYSPLHNIREGVNYPATLVTTADHDDRVVPAHSFKYIAALQEKYKGMNPVLIRIETKAGHGGGKPTTKTIEEIADIYSFTFYNLGVALKY